MGRSCGGAVPCDGTERGVGERCRRVDKGVQWGGRRTGVYQEVADAGDHRAVVGAQAGRWDADGEAGVGAAFFGEGADAGVGGDASDDDEGVNAVVAAGGDGATGEDVGDGFLKCGGAVSDGKWLVGVVFGPAVGGGGLQAGEGEVEGAGGRPREADGVGVAGAGGMVDPAGASWPRNRWASVWSSSRSTTTTATSARARPRSWPSTPGSTPTTSSTSTSASTTSPIRPIP